MEQVMQKWVKTSKESLNEENKTELNPESDHEGHISKSPVAGISGTSQRSLSICETSSSSINIINNEEMLDESLAEPSTSTNTTSKRYVQRINLSKLKDKFNWLDRDKSFLFCKTCNLKISGQKFHLKRHEESGSHQRSTKAAKITPQITTILTNPAKQKMENLVKEAEL
ncbi:unnamed protein product [Psylliodes chrysocephalus]|uniref:Uncharacterized protein n=1 Tax=Psylliodes chrysocephalus TaxID=3402493 RepID=A0A9P0GM32_9CUCU|nr:unnamed protein product [Psylliodes chrysocephala]